MQVGLFYGSVTVMRSVSSTPSSARPALLWPTGKKTFPCFSLCSFSVALHYFLIVKCNKIILWFQITRKMCVIYSGHVRSWNTCLGVWGPTSTELLCTSSWSLFGVHSKGDRSWLSSRFCVQCDGKSYSLREQCGSTSCDWKRNVKGVTAVLNSAFP